MLARCVNQNEVNPIEPFPVGMRQRPASQAKRLGNRDDLPDLGSTEPTGTAQVIDVPNFRQSVMLENGLGDRQDFTPSLVSGLRNDD